MVHDADIQYERGRSARAIAVHVDRNVCARLLLVERYYLSVN